jgi:hypothetical protein
MLYFEGNNPDCLILFSRIFKKHHITCLRRPIVKSRNKYNMPNNRPICKSCNKNHTAVNYIKNGTKHFRSICTECGKKKVKKSYKPLWQKSGYKKKQTCDICGFKSIYLAQTTVFHIDGNLNNIAFSNLRTICLNCVEVVKRKEITWKRGDLEVDY